MGLGYIDILNLIELRRETAGGAAITLGRQNIALHPSELEQLRSKLSHDTAACSWLEHYTWLEYADTFLADVLKFDRVESIDYSPYEGATVIHDIGRRLPEQYDRRFDLALDGGTLEHVFHFPTAIANLMRLTRVGGHVYGVSPCNNHCGHGFYQFSPELMFRVFSEASGYKVSYVRITPTSGPSAEHFKAHYAYEVTDPAIVHQRVTLINARPTLMRTLARCIDEREPLTEPVLQSDYRSQWQENAPSMQSTLGRLRKVLLGDKRPPFYGHMDALRARWRSSRFNRQFYRRVTY